MVMSDKFYLVHYSEKLFMERKEFDGCRQNGANSSISTSLKCIFKKQCLHSFLDMDCKLQQKNSAMFMQECMNGLLRSFLHVL